MTIPKATNRFISYLKAGKLLHIITFIEVSLSTVLFATVDVGGWLTTGGLFLKLIALSPTVCMPVLAQLDAHSRFQNYKLLKDKFFMYGFQARIVKPFVKSRCQRDATKAAAAELGYLKNCQLLFKEHGYKWYHLFPDTVFNNPTMLFTKNFWKTTLFTETYLSKINFAKAEMMKIENARISIISV